MVRMRSPVRIWIAAPHRGIAQLVEQRSPKPRAVSSKLTTPAITPGTLLGAPGVLFCRRALEELCHASEGAFHPPPNCLRQSGPTLRTLALANSRSCQPEENDSGKIMCLFLKILLDNARLLRYNSQRSRGQNAANLSDHGPVAQLVRAPACHAGGRRFEPDPGRHLLL